MRKKRKHVMSEKFQSICTPLPLKKTAIDVKNAGSHVCIMTDFTQPSILQASDTVIQIWRSCLT